MEKRRIIRLEKQINDLQSSLAALADRKQFGELLRIIHKPGWTTIAEQLLVTGVVDSMLAQTKALVGLKQVLIDGAAKVELNPQPLPPKE